MSSAVTLRVTPCLDPSEEVLAAGDTVIILDTLGRSAVDDAEDAAALLGFGVDDFNRVGGGAEAAVDPRDPERSCLTWYAVLYGWLSAHICQASSKAVLIPSRSVYAAIAFS